MHAILRSFNDPRVTEIIDSLEATGQVSDVWVAINSEVDRVDTAKLLRSYAGGLNVTPVPLENYGWSKALNTCLRMLMEKAPGNDRVLIISNQVNFTAREVKDLAHAAAANEASCGYALFSERREPTYLMPRNTFIVWKQSVFTEVGMFDESLDEDTGMEDVDLALRIYERRGALPFLGARNVSLELNRHLDFAEKLEWEKRGVEKIEKRFAPELVENFLRHIASQNKES
jgi:hypothetical protein